MLFIEESDPIRLALMYEVAKRVLDIQETKDHNLAVDIANQVGKTFGG